MEGFRLFGRCMEFLQKQTANLRIDTHEENRVMRHLIEKAGLQNAGSSAWRTEARESPISMWAKERMLQKKKGQVTDTAIERNRIFFKARPEFLGFACRPFQRGRAGFIFERREVAKEQFFFAA